jgi:hypothetical protein
MSPQAIANYEAVLAAIGRRFDREKWTQVCVMEMEGGILVQGTCIVPTSEAYAVAMHTQVLDQGTLSQMVVASREAREAEQ